ncbi:PLD nuclease N-terminal domain-containing protein [Mongoliibacter ruber]|uniref:Phospholipase D-like protein n=1 Tax=Mongoliibacter ruber TaxID=1750599 RepID=A0A2T0WRC9_9BACT|nr:PLD nuclease N-terminal domain-containing protein [Mongoliibacter ruber]PRY89256.1 phospholipase D-like protein [Mongoliibacter ruber]
MTSTDTTMGITFILAVLYGSLSLWAMWDWSKNNRLSKTNKIIWLGLILFLHPIGPFLYFHAEFNKRKYTRFQRHHNA